MFIVSMIMMVLSLGFGFYAYGKWKKLAKTHLFSEEA